MQVDIADRNGFLKPRRAMYDPQATCFLGRDAFDPPVSNPWPLEQMPRLFPSIVETIEAAGALTRNHLRLEDNMLIRIDMYVVDGQVWLGELTPTPGNLNGDGPQKVADYLSVKYFPNIEKCDEIMRTT